MATISVNFLELFIFLQKKKFKPRTFPLLITKNILDTVHVIYSTLRSREWK
jgi:hypothetical protein